MIAVRAWGQTRMENWNQDLSERYSKFCGLYIKFQSWKMALHLVRSTEKAGSLVRTPGHRKWRKACINTCKHILKFSNCVLLRVPINHNNYEQPIALFVIIPAKNTFTNQYGVIYCWRQVDVMVATSINKWVDSPTRRCGLYYNKRHDLY